MTPTEVVEMPVEDATEFACGFFSEYCTREAVKRFAYSANCAHVTHNLCLTHAEFVLGNVSRWGYIWCGACIKQGVNARKVLRAVHPLRGAS